MVFLNQMPSPHKPATEFRDKELLKLGHPVTWHCHSVNFG